MNRMSLTGRFFKWIAIAFFILAPLRLAYLLRRDMANPDIWEVGSIYDPRIYGTVCVGVALAMIGLFWKAWTAGRQLDEAAKQGKVQHRR